MAASRHIAAPESAVRIGLHETRPGDVMAFRRVGDGVIAHVAIIESVLDIDNRERLIEFWHSLNATDGGVRRDSLLTNGDAAHWSHERLADDTRYCGHFFVRPSRLTAV